MERLDRRNRRIAIIAVNGRVVEAELFQLRLQVLDGAAGCAFAERAVVLVAVRVFVRAVELFERFAARHAIRRQVILLLERLDCRNRRIAVAAIDIGVVEAELFQLRLQVLDCAAGCAFAERIVVLVAVRVLVHAVELFERFAARHAVRRQVILLLERANRRVCARTKRAVHRAVVIAQLLQLRLQVLDGAAAVAHAERIIVLGAVRVLVDAVELFERLFACNAIRRQVVLLLERLDRRDGRVAIIAIDISIIIAEFFQLCLQILDVAARAPLFQPRRAAGRTGTAGRLGHADIRFIDIAGVFPVSHFIPAAALAENLQLRAFGQGLQGIAGRGCFFAQTEFARSDRRRIRQGGGTAQQHQRHRAGQKPPQTGIHHGEITPFRTA